jgi:hypothetical protein
VWRNTNNPLALLGSPGRSQLLIKIPPLVRSHLRLSPLTLARPGAAAPCQITTLLVCATHGIKYTLIFSI